MKYGVDCALKSGAVFPFGVVVLTLLLSGCMNDSKRAQFYMLNADSGVAGATLAPSNELGPVIGLGPIRIPEYLNRPQMIVATADNQYQISEDHRWAERLDQNISLALFKALPHQLGTDRIVRFPWAQRQVVDYQVGIDILEFNVDARGRSRLIAQWFVKPKDKPAIDRRSEYQFPASTTDYALMVRAQSQCLTKLGEEISSTLRRLMASKGGKYVKQKPLG
ncbi:MAG: PqiC family protein [Methylococcales bacterium]|nr:PqiC family protein [Methylococcales bacterium]